MARSLSGAVKRSYRSGLGSLLTRLASPRQLLELQRSFETVPAAPTYYGGNRDEALQLLLAPA